MFCNYCGHQISEKARFCPNCGQQIAGSPPPPVPQDQPPTAPGTASTARSAQDGSRPRPPQSRSVLADPGGDSRGRWNNPVRGVEW
jgi:hypothetical protein